jgi:phosphoadenosine phosphosulfate reductase
MGAPAADLVGDRTFAGAMAAWAIQVDPAPLVLDLSLRYRDLDGFELLCAVIDRDFFGRVAVVSSFGADSAVLLDLVAQIDPATPVIFLDSGKHFPETRAYRDRLVDHLGLSDVRSVRPDPGDLAAQDPDGSLWQIDPDRCCDLRKVRPLQEALAGFDAWITGRKQHQGGDRTRLPIVEATDGRIKVNPLARWSRDRVLGAFRSRGLPSHPLVGEGYSSIGCAPCTRPTAPDEALRDGRWTLCGKTECGIHRAAWART